MGGKHDGTDPGSHRATSGAKHRAPNRRPGTKNSDNHGKLGAKWGEVKAIYRRNHGTSIDIYRRNHGTSIDIHRIKHGTSIDKRRRNPGAFGAGHRPKPIGRRRRHLVTALVVAMFTCGAAGCSSAPPTAESQTPSAAMTVLELCESGADRVTDRLQEFLSTLPDISPDEFLALPAIEGLAAFQDDIAIIINESTHQSSTACNLDTFQELVGTRLDALERDGVLEEFLIATIRSGRQLKTADVRIEPDDDVESVLSLLDDGSTLTFAPGVYELERPLLLQRSIALVGAGVGDTVLRSSSTDAAIVVVGRGRLSARDLSIEHHGDAPASVILAFARPVDLARVNLSGGISAEDGSGGNGVVLSDEVFAGLDPAPGAEDPSLIASAKIHNNDGAGLAISGSVTATIDRSEISNNTICGLCYFGAARGELTNSTIHANELGVQIADQAEPEVRANVISASSVAGLVIVGEAAPEIADNSITGNGEVGVAVQDFAAPRVESNRIAASPVGVSVLADAAAVITANAITEVDVGIQLDAGSSPTVTDNRVEGSTAAGIATRGEATGRLTDNEIFPADGIGLVIEGTSAPVIEGLRIAGGVVAVAYTGDGAGSLSRAEFTDQEIGIQLDERAAPEIEGLEINNPTSAGIVARGSTTATIRSAAIIEAAEVGFAVIDQATPSIRNTTVRGGPTGASLLGESAATVSGNRFVELEVGIQIGESATPTIEDNRLDSMTSAGMVFVGDSSGLARGNVIDDPQVIGIQLAESASPSLEENVFFSPHPADDEPDQPAIPVGDGPGVVEPAEVEDQATVAILYAGQAAGSAERNQMVGFVIGIQIAEQAEPELNDNSIDGGSLVGVGLLYRDDGAGRAAGNETARHAVGFQVGGQAKPQLVANTVTSARNVAILVQESAQPTLERNVCPADLAGIGMLNGTDPQRFDNDCVEVRGGE